MEQILLKDICDLDNGYAFKSDDYVDESNTLNCRMSNIRPDGSFDIMYSSKYLPDEFAKKYSEYLLKDGDLIIAMTDMAGDPKILGVPTVVDTRGYNVLLNQRVGRLRFIREGVNADYLKLALQSPKVRTYLKRFAGGGVQLNVSKKDILNAPVLMRSEDEQIHIANLFKKVIDIKKQREQEIEYLDNLIKSRFVEMFGQPFDTTRWIVKELKDVSESMIDGSNVNPDYYEIEGDVLFLRIQNVWRNEFRLDDSVYISQEINRKYYYDTSLKTGDLLVTKIGRYYTKDSSLGRVSVYRGEDDCANYSNNIMRVRLNDSVNSEFVNVLLNLDDYQSYIKRTSKGGTDKRALSKSLIGSYPIIIPPKVLQDEFVSFVEQVTKLKFEVQKSLDETQILMDSLMQQYFG